MATTARTVDPSNSTTEATTFLPSPRNLSDLRVMRMPRGGVDRLNFETWDTIEVVSPAGQGERIRDVVHLRGYYMIERCTPTSADWSEASVDIYMREMVVEGVSEKFGRVRASVNHEIGEESRGQVTPGTIFDSPLDSPKMCEMDAFMQFELPDVGVTVFNKEVIRLEHSITHIPPVGQGGGTPGEVEIGLYSTQDPGGPPVAFLRRVKTHIGAWLNE